MIIIIMKSFTHLVTLFLTAALLAGFAGPLRAADPSLTLLAGGDIKPARSADANGKWNSEFETPIGHTKYVFNLKSADGKISGEALRERDGETSTNALSEGKIKDDDISFVEQAKIQDQDIRIEYSGKISGDEMKLTRKVGDFGTTDIVAKREKAASDNILLAGKWQSEFDTQIGLQKYQYEFKLDGDTLTGRAVHDLNGEKASADIKGKVTGSDVTFVEPFKFQDMTIDISYTGKIAGDDIKFTRKVGDFATEELVAHRVK
jgi:hypothetical protein